MKNNFLLNNKDDPNINSAYVLTFKKKKVDGRTNSDVGKEQKDSTFGKEDTKLLLGNIHLMGAYADTKYLVSCYMRKWQTWLKIFLRHA